MLFDVLAERIFAKAAGPGCFQAQAPQGDSRVIRPAGEDMEIRTVDFVSQAREFRQTGENQIAEISPVQKNLARIILGVQHTLYCI
jgi:malonyl CoA-acyl carrier protein transacylase